MTPEWAWVAGLYEGEGSLTRLVDKRNGVITWTLNIASTDVDVIERLHKMTGVGTLSPQPRQQPHWQDKVRWAVRRRDDIAFVLTEITPLLGTRRAAKAKEFMDWYASTSRVNA